MLIRQLVTQWLQQTVRDQVADRTRTVRDQTSPSSTEQSQSAVRLAFVFATNIEAGGMVDQLQERVTTVGDGFSEHDGLLDQRRVIIVESGPGRAAAARATEYLIAEHRPHTIVAAGFASALSPELRRGHFLLANQVRDTRGAEAPIGIAADTQAVENSPALHVGRLLSIDQVVRTEREKRQLGESFHALACDMETIAIGQVCQQRAIDMLSVHIVTDAVDEPLPREVEQLLNQKTMAAKLGAAAGAILGRPSSIKDMWQMHEDAVKASDRLARFLTGVANQLAI